MGADEQEYEARETPESKLVKVSVWLSGNVYRVYAPGAFYSDHCFLCWLSPRCCDVLAAAIEVWGETAKAAMQLAFAGLRITAAADKVAVWASPRISLGRSLSSSGCVSVQTETAFFQQLRSCSIFVVRLLSREVEAAHP